MEGGKLGKLKALTDSIRAGQRVVLLPPGIFVVVASIFLLLFTTVLLVGSMISLLGRELLPQHKALIQFSSFFLIIVFIISPSFMLIQGKKKFIKRKYYYSLSVILVGVLMILLNSAKGNDQVIPLYMGVLGGVSSFLLIKAALMRYAGSFTTYSRCRR